MKRLLVFLCVLSILSCGSSTETVDKVKPKNLMDYDHSSELTKVLDKAEKEKKIVFLDVYTDWCLPCKMFEQEVLADKPTADFMNDNFINYKVNAEKLEGPDIALIYSVDAYPTLLFLDHRGRVLQKHVGGIGIQKFNILAEEALETNIDPY